MPDENQQPADEAGQPVEPDDPPLSDPGDGLSLKQEQAVLALLRETTIAKAAEAVDVNHKTIYRWLREPAFSAVYRRSRRDAFSQAVGMMQQYAPLAVQTLVKLMADVKTPAHVQVTASATLLKFGREGIELDDLAARLEALEQAAKREPVAGGMR